MSKCSPNLGIIKEFILQRNHTNVKNAANTFQVPLHGLDTITPIGDKHYTREECCKHYITSLLVSSNIKEFIYERNHTSVKNVLRSFGLTETWEN